MSHASLGARKLRTTCTTRGMVAIVAQRPLSVANVGGRLSRATSSAVEQHIRDRAQG
ncbi:MAG TPA: hypothetical protein VG650_00035 [Mycobacteriales bacterium]|nr:hypothetical protein [Mycobacteriales bacterium]